MTLRVLLAEDRASLRQALAETLARSGYTVLEATEGAQAMALIEEGGFDLGLFDLKMPVHSGLDLLVACKERWPLVPVVLLTAYGSVEVAVQAMKAGADDFLSKPVETDHLLLVIKKALDTGRKERLHDALSADLARSPAFQEIVGTSPALKAAQEQASRIAATDTTCLILGETGAGKELFARAIHWAGSRHDQPFVAVNCAAIPGTLLENELFGHEKGAYTGAYETSIGRFEYAHRGSIFLDEIGEMSQDLQAKLLRVIEEKTFTRVGGHRPIHVDVRILCATNRDLSEMVQERHFRQDLFFRLSAFPIRVPPLRERREDIRELADHFLNHFRKELGRPQLHLAPEAVEWLRTRPWPGNVRELMNAIERAAILADPQGQIDAGLLKGGGLRLEPATPPPFQGIEDASEWLALETLWRAEEVLKRCGQDKKKAARLLGVPLGKLEEMLGRGRGTGPAKETKPGPLRIE